jgi:ankyrin repeat protein
MPSSLLKALDELPTSLDDTYKRALEGIPKEQQQHASRIFQCLVAAIRPLRVEELAEIFAIEFDPEVAPQLSEGWRPENPEEAVLSACSTLISIIEAKGSKIVQFSHFSVKEFLRSGRRLTLEVGSIRQYHIHLDAAHAILARACLTVLLQFDEEVNKKRLLRFPLAFYIARHWIVHARFEGVASRVQEAMKRLFNPQEPFLIAWVSIHDVDDVWFRSSVDAPPEHSLPPRVTALYYAVLCGFSRLVTDYIITHGEDVNARCGNYGSPLHAASYHGHLEVALILLSHGADVNLGDDDDKSPLVAAYRGRSLDVMRLLLEHGAAADVEYDKHGCISHEASRCGEADVVELLLGHKADLSARGSKNWTPLYWASMQGHLDVIQLLLERGVDINTRSSDDWTPLHTASKNGREKAVKLLMEHGALVNAQSITQQIPLHVASQFGRLDVVRVLLEHGADVRLRHRENNQTAFQGATSSGHQEIARLLLEHGAEEE